MSKAKYYIYNTPDNAKIDPCNSGKSIDNIVKNATKTLVRRKDLPKWNKMIGFRNGITIYYDNGKYIFATRVDKCGETTSIV